MWGNFWAAVLFLSCALALPAGASEDAAARLKAIELQGLSALSENRIEELLSAPTRRHSGIEYTRNWLDEQPPARGDKQWACLSEALYFEARGETVKGQFAVAEVILNRVASQRFPDTICGVIHQGTGRKFQCQFTYTCDGRAEVITEKVAHGRVQKVARAVLDGVAPNLTNGATHYHTVAVRPNWSRVYTRTTKIGVHVFYRHTFRTASNNSD